MVPGSLFRRAVCGLRVEHRPIPLVGAGATRRASHGAEPLVQNSAGRSARGWRVPGAGGGRRSARVFRSNLHVAIRRIASRDTRPCGAHAPLRHGHASRAARPRRGLWIYAKPCGMEDRPAAFRLLPCRRHSAGLGHAAGAPGSRHAHVEDRGYLCGRALGGVAVGGVLLSRPAATVDGPMDGPPGVGVGRRVDSVRHGAPGISWIPQLEIRARRGAPLGFVGTRLEIPLKLVPVVEKATYGSLDYQQSREVGYEDQAKTDDAKKKRAQLIKDGKLAPEVFDKSFEETPRSEEHTSELQSP